MTYGPITILSNWGGVQVFESSYLPEFTLVSKKKLKPKKWHKSSRGAYAKRVQKKWDKKHGITRELYILRTAEGIFVHPNTNKRLTQVITGVTKNGNTS